MKVKSQGCQELLTILREHSAKYVGARDEAVKLLGMPTCNSVFLSNSPFSLQYFLEKWTNHKIPCAYLYCSCRITAIDSEYPSNPRFGYLTNNVTRIALEPAPADGSVNGSEKMGKIILTESSLTYCALIHESHISKQAITITDMLVGIFDMQCWILLISTFIMLYMLIIFLNNVYKSITENPDSRNDSTWFLFYGMMKSNFGEQITMQQIYPTFAGGICQRAMSAWRGNRVITHFCDSGGKIAKIFQLLLSNFQGKRQRFPLSSRPYPKLANAQSLLADATGTRNGFQNVNWVYFYQFSGDRFKTAQRPYLVCFLLTWTTVYVIVSSMLISRFTHFLTVTKQQTLPFRTVNELVDSNWTVLGGSPARASLLVNKII